MRTFREDTKRGGVKNNLNPTSPKIAKRFAALDKEYGVTYFHDQRQAIIEKYGLKG